jgi:hypothetical protein
MSTRRKDPGITGVKKDNVISFRITDEERENFSKICRMNNKRISDLMREAFHLYNNGLSNDLLHLNMHQVK